VIVNVVGSILLCMKLQSWWWLHWQGWWDGWHGICIV